MTAPDVSPKAILRWISRKKITTGTAVSVEAAIIAVSDTFDAMTTDRPYAAARTEAEAIAELRRYAGIHYHSEVVRAFCASLERAARGLFET